MMFDKYLNDSLNRITNSNVKKAMAYSLFAGGKRVRPALAIALMKAYGDQVERIYPFACAIEMIHTYSLIHDDLPAMDDDTLRRGKNTCHVEFDEATAILAGDALLTEAFYQVSLCKTTAEIKIQLIQLLSDYAGANGMVLGQCLDMEAENHNQLTVMDLQKIHENKTGKLLTIPLIGAALLSNHEKDINMWKEIGRLIGLSFQIQDDVLDVTSSTEVLGKNINSDLVNQKATYVSVLGLDEAIKLSNTYYEEAFCKMKELAIDIQPLEILLDKLSNRVS